MYLPVLTRRTSAKQPSWFSPSSIAGRAVVLVMVFLLLVVSYQPISTAQIPTNCLPQGAPQCTVNVAGVANPWLAGMPNGTNAGDGDFAPGQSPTQANCIPITPGQLLKFNITGTVSHGPGGCCPVTGPDGSGVVMNHQRGAQFGKSNISAPLNALLGVFLGPEQPTDPTPAALDFSTPASRDFATLSPQLKQVFFIGDGRSSAGCQSFVVPAGATRLFLGVMDGFEWVNNIGSFSVSFSTEAPPQPSTCAPAGSPCCSLSVPGTSNPYLAGAPAGRSAGFGDVAPTHSPVGVGCIPITPGDQYNFQSTGTVSNGPPGCCPVNNPEGNGIGSAPSQFGISGITAPINALVGVFLGPNDPALTAAPPALDFSTPAARDYTVIAPQLKQVFFIGDGLAGATCQRVTAPAGATRLFLGTMDLFGWSNNTGAFSVTACRVGMAPPGGGFDFCLQDELTNNFVRFNSQTGEYTFTSCGFFIISGVATVIIRGCLIDLVDARPDRRFTAQVDTCQFRGTAAAQPFAGGGPTIVDRDYRNNSCVCQ